MPVSMLSGSSRIIVRSFEPTVGISSLVGLTIGDYVAERVVSEYNAHLMSVFPLYSTLTPESPSPARS